MSMTCGHQDHEGMATKITKEEKPGRSPGVILGVLRGKFFVGSVAHRLCVEFQHPFRHAAYAVMLLDARRAAQPHVTRLARVIPNRREAIGKTRGIVRAR